MPFLGAHMSIAGGLPRAVDRARAAGCDALQIFTKSVGQWRARPLPADEVREFRSRLAASGIRRAVAHNSYLINLAASSPTLRAQSMNALAEELDRAEALGLEGLVMHPGSFTTGSEEAGLALVADGLREILRTRPRTGARIILEHTAGQGTNLGHRFEHLETIIRRLRGSPRLGVCLDTCHLIAAGYDIRTRAGYEQMFAGFDSSVGLERLAVVHLNDSKRPCGSRVDRHEHIGQGCLGLTPFELLLNDPRFADVPMLLETPKSDAPEHRKLPVDPFDEMNLQTLRGLLRKDRLLRKDVRGPSSKSRQSRLVANGPSLTNKSPVTR